MIRIGLGTLQDEFELSGETQAFLGWRERLRPWAAEVRTFSPQGETLRAFKLLRVESGEFVFRKFFEQWTFIRQALRLAASVDLIHVFLPTPDFLWIADRIKERSGLPIAVTCLGEKPMVGLRAIPSLLRRSFRFHAVRILAARFLPKGRFLCERYVAGNAAVARQLREAGCPSHRIAIQTPCLPKEPPPDPFSLELAERMAERPTFLYLGHFLPNKGVDLLLEAFSRLERGRARLLLVWSGLGRLAEVERQRERLGLEDRVSLVERQIHRSTLLARACGLVMPFRVPYGQVSPPITALEALRAGVPVVLPRFPSLSDLFPDGEGALFFPPGDAGALAEKMRWILDHPRQASRMRGIQRDIFASQVRGVKMDGFYRSLLHG